MKALFIKSFEYYDTHGLSLEDQHDLLRERDPELRIDLFQFAKDATNAGWSFNKIKATITAYANNCSISLKFL